VSVEVTKINIEHVKEINDLKRIVQQLWACLRQGYTYDEAQIHIQAYMNGMTTERKVVVVENKE
jgi:hypothetical protein